MTEELRELEEMIKHGIAHLKEDLENSPEDSEDLEDLLKTFTRVKSAFQDPKAHQLILDLFVAFSYLDQASDECEDDYEDEDELDI